MYFNINTYPQYPSIKSQRAHKINGKLHIGSLSWKVYVENSDIANYFEYQLNDKHFIVFGFNCRALYVSYNLLAKVYCSLLILILSTSYENTNIAFLWKNIYSYNKSLVITHCHASPAFHISLLKGKHHNYHSVW